MKKILLITCCAAGVMCPLTAMFKKPADGFNFHGFLMNQQIQNMICHDRADELKLWLDHASQKRDFSTPFIKTLHALAMQQNAQQSADVLLEFMLKNGL